MASTTIRVSSRTRDQLNALCAQSGRSADAVISELISKAQEESLLDAAANHWHLMAEDGKLLAHYRHATEGLEAFDAELPDY